MENFRTYQLAVEFFRGVKSVELPGYLRSQLLRAASSIVLNLGEGYGKFSHADQRRFYHIAFGSVRECQALFDIIDIDVTQQSAKLDHLAASLFKLLRT